MNKLYLLIIISFFISCEKKIEKKDENGNLMKLYYLNSKGNLNGTYKKFDENGKISVIHNYDNGKLIDSSIYYKNGIIDEIIYVKNSDTNFVKVFNNGKIYAIGNSYNKKKLVSGIFIIRINYQRQLSLLIYVEINTLIKVGIT